MYTPQNANQEIEPISPDKYDTNEVEHSCIDLECDQVEFNIYFDGTWNSKENSDFYNDPDRPMEQRNDPKYNPKSRILNIPLGASISFARAPTGVDRLHRSTKMSDPHVIALYVDGAGAETPETLPDGTKKYKGDDMWGAGSGWGHTGAYTKLHTMFKQVQSSLEKYAADGHKLPTIITFNVYGFSRGAATARMFCNRIIKQKNDLKEVLQYVNLQQFNVILKFVGLFDTVSSIGFDHTNDVSADHQGLDFEPNQITKIVHIAAANEYRQKFNLTNIAVPVERGYGLEFALPGCHTDIGDGLGTEGKVIDTVVEDQEMALPIRQTEWYVKARDDDSQVILQRKKKYNADSNKKVSSSNLIPIARTESIALQSQQYADYEIVRKNLISEGWFKENEIIGNTTEKLEQLVIDRKQISLDYPKIPTYLMIEFIKDYHAYFLLEDKLKLYSIDRAEYSGELQKMFDNIKPQVKALDIQKQKQALTGELRNDNVLEQPRIDILGDIQLKNTMYNRYLHWGAAMGSEFTDSIIQVNIGQIDHTKNVFYRTIVSG